MLQMDCPSCNEVIQSQFLADVSTIECGRCKKTIPVKDVFVTTKSFVMHREDFLNRTFRFQKLLREVEKELLLLTNNQEASPKSLESLEQFYASLQELLAGARNNYRMDVQSDVSVEVIDGNSQCKGKLLNLSTSGASVELMTFDKLPRIKSVVDLVFPFPEFSEHLYARARVVWTKDQTNKDRPHQAIIGANFVDLDENGQNCIWNYILDNAPVPLQRMSK
jgi:hypothetical protein